MRSPTASTACRRIAARDCAGQATVEFALVAVAFLSVVLGMGALGHVRGACAVVRLPLRDGLVAWGAGGHGAVLAFGFARR